ncbi:hypothetical protein ABKN59_004555 [Abortiporus biennis]
MHRALFNDDIVSLILENLSLRQRDPASINEFPMRIPTLASLAITCHALYEPTMNALWYSHRALAPVLRCLGDCIGERAITDEDLYTEFAVPSTKLYLRGPINASHLQAMKKNSLRIHELKVDLMPSSFNGVTDIDPNILLALRACGDKKLFPNIQTFDWPLEGVDISSFPPEVTELFLNHNVTSTMVSLPLNNQMISVGLVRRFSYISPRIRHLYLSFHPFPHEVRLPRAMEIMRHEYIKGLLEGLPYITHLTLPVYDVLDLGSVWPVLANARHLVDLKVALTFNECSRYAGSTLFTSGLCFSALQSLEIIVTRPYLLVLLACSSQFPELNIFRAECKRTVGFDLEHFDILDITDALSRRCSRHKLQEIAISSYLHDYNISFDRSERFIQEGRLHRLAIFNNLLELRLPPWSFLDISEGALINLVRSWPRIKCISFSSVNQYPPVPTQFTLQGLLGVTRLCPDLEYFSYHIDGDPIPSMITTNIPIHTSLKYLGVGKSDHKVRCAQSVAHFLFKCFPNLEEVAGYRTDWLSTVSEVTNDIFNFQSVL